MQVEVLVLIKSIQFFLAVFILLLLSPTECNAGATFDRLFMPVSSLSFLATTRFERTTHENENEEGMKRTSSTANFNLKAQYNSVHFERVKTFPRSKAADIIDATLFPQNEYTQRLKIARDVQFKSDDSDNNNNSNPSSSSTDDRIMTASDPRLSFTYDEFPVQSMDRLLDLAVEEYKEFHGGTRRSEQQQPSVLVDLGSGCGRLVLHAALCNKGTASTSSTGNDNGDFDCGDLNFQHIHGIEISRELHEIGQRALEIGAREGFFTKIGTQSIEEDTNADVHADTNSNSNVVDDDHKPSVNLHLGPADDFEHILHQADIIFSYSTVFDTKGFNEEMGAMILSDEWSKMLAEKCKKGCVIVTTDRALDPQFGWKLCGSMEVDNPKLFGTTGYVSILI